MLHSFTVCQPNLPKTNGASDRSHLRVGLALLVALFAMMLPASAQLYSWENLAGMPGGSGNADGLGSNARFNTPRGVAVDSSGNIFVADQQNHTIRKVTPGGEVTTLAGSPGVFGNSDGTGSAARFNQPSGIVVTSTGIIYVGDYRNHTIRKVTQAGEVTTLAGSPGISGSDDGLGNVARFKNPLGVALDSSGDLYVADQFNYTIRKVTAAGEVTTLAGSPGLSASVDGTGSAARFRFPGGVAVSGAGDVYVSDHFGQTIRKVTTAGEVTTLAGSPGLSGNTDGTGSAARFNSPVGLAVDGSNNIYVADQTNHTIRKVTLAGEVTTFAGSPGLPGSAVGTGSAARFNNPGAIAIDSFGDLYVADQSNHAIRKVIAATALVTTPVGNPPSPGSINGTGSAARFNNPKGLTADGADTLYVADLANHTIRKVTAAGVVTTLAGSAGLTGGVDGTGTAARFSNPSGVRLNSNGDLYVADQSNHTIRKVTALGEVTTIAGVAGLSGSDNGTGSVARFSYPADVAVNSAGDIFVSDQFNHTIRKVTPAGEVTTFAGSVGNSGTTDGTGVAAQFDQPVGLAMDGDDNLYVADQFNHTIRKVSPAGVVTTFAGGPGIRGSADGSASAARFNLPAGVTVDAADNVFVADAFNSTVRKITSAGVVTTIGGMTGVIGGKDGAGTAAQFGFPSAITVGPTGRLYFTDGTNNCITRGTLPLAEMRLSNLSLSQGTLAPGFDPDTFTYTAVVTNVVSSLTVTPTVVDPGSTVKVNGITVGSGTPSGNIALNFGPNPITIVVTASDLVNTRTYTVGVTRLTEIETWRQFYFGSPANTGNGADSFDFDGDGFVNGSEFAAGIVPTDASSRLNARAESVPGQPGQKKIIFSPRLASRTYVVTFRTDLTTGSWAPLVGSSSSDIGDERTVIDLNATGPEKFYRVELTYP